MRITLLLLFLPVYAFAQSNQEIFGIRTQLTLPDKDEAVMQMVPLDNGNRLLVVGKNQLQFWDVGGAKLIDSTPHRITGYWTGGALMRIVSFPKTAGFPLFMNQNRMKVSPDGSIGITITKPADESKSKVKVAVAWNLRTGESLGSLIRGTSSVREAEFSADGSTIMTIHGDLKDTELAFWDSKTLAHRNSIQVRNLSFRQLTSDGEHVLVGAAGANKWMGVTVMSYDPSDGIALLNTRTGKLEKKFGHDAAKFRSMIFVSPDGKYLVDRTVSDQIVVWEITGDGEPKFRIDQPSARINHGIMGFSPDSRYLLTMTKNEARIYDHSSGNLYRRFPIREEATYSLASDGRYAIMRATGWVAAYDLEKEKISFATSLKVETQQRENEADSKHEVENTVTSPDGKYMMIYGSNNIRIYAFETGELVQTIIDPQRARYDDKGKLKNGGLETGGKAGWLASGNSIYASASDGRSVYFWNKK